MYSTIRWFAPVGVAAAVLVTSAGACQRDVDRPAPAPEDLGAAPIPGEATRSGLDSVYARLTRTDRPADGGPPIECFHLVRLVPDGAARFGHGCTDAGDGATGLLDDPAIWPGDTERADYGYADGRLWLRAVAWDPLAEEYALAEYTAAYCDGSLALGGEPGLGDPTYALVSGAAPPGAPPCR